MINWYAADYNPGPNWLDGKPLNDQPLDDHVEYLVGLHRNGKVIMGGPFGDGTGGLVVFAAFDILDIEDLVARDPAIVDGVLVATVKHWARIV